VRGLSGLVFFQVLKTSYLPSYLSNTSTDSALLDKYKYLLYHYLPSQVDPKKAKLLDWTPLMPNAGQIEHYYL